MIIKQNWKNLENFDVVGNKKKNRKAGESSWLHPERIINGFFMLSKRKMYPLHYLCAAAAAAADGGWA